jgi:hypothetical protein
MIYKIIPILLTLLFAQKTSNANLIANKISTPKVVASVVTTNSESRIAMVYNTLKSNQFGLPNLQSFAEALKGFYLLKEKGYIQKDILTLIDFSLSSNVKRLWVIDLDTNTILYNSLVAHGKNSGDEFAKSFSNGGQTFKSSLGFYATGEIYNGAHGMSLRLDGLEKGVNDMARARGVVMHAANYVSESFIKNNKRLGRSLGCPAIPEALSKDIINTIKNKSCLFIYFPSGSITNLTHPLTS